MSHFTVLVIGDNPEEQLEPFSEELRVPIYKVGEVSDEERDSFIKYYYKKSDLFSGETDEDIPLNWEVFEKLYQDEGSTWNSNAYKKDKKKVWCEYSTYNPKSKWDWYVLGGRWSGMIKLKEGAGGVKGESGVMDNEVGIDQAYKCDIANIDKLCTFAVLKDGEWYERGKMGWWAIVTDEKEDGVWEAEHKKLIEELPDNTLISIYDCHIKLMFLFASCILVQHDNPSPEKVSETRARRTKSSNYIFILNRSLYHDRYFITGNKRRTSRTYHC